MSTLDIFTYSGQQEIERGERIYAIELGDVVKVGRSSDASRRLGTHSSHALALGVPTGRAWVSRILVSSVAAENELIRLCALEATAASREYFPIPMERVVEIASAINLTALDRIASESGKCLAAAIEGLKDAISGADRNVAPEVAAAQVVSMWRKLDADGYAVFQNTRTDWQSVSLLLAQQIVAHPSSVLDSQIDLMEADRIWAHSDPL